MHIHHPLTIAHLTDTRSLGIPAMDSVVIEGSLWQ